MAINWMDNFTVYGTDGGAASRMLNGVYAQAVCALQADPDPTANGQFCLRLNGIGGTIVRKVLPTARTTVGVALRTWQTNLVSNTGQQSIIAQFSDVSNNIHLFVCPDPSGNLLVYRNDNGGAVQIAATATPVIIANAWQHVETKVVFDVAAGSIQIKVQGITVLNVSGIRTVSNIGGVVASCQNVTLRNVVSVDFYIKDFIIWDNTGAFNNDFMGSCQVLRINPDADVALNWTPVPGPNGFNMINGVTPADDVTYISAFAPLPAPINGVLSATAGGALAGATYFVRSTWVNSTGETLASVETSLAVAANNVLNVAAPASPPFGATGWNVYVSTTTGTETRQNGGVPIAINTAWVEPTTGLVAGAALPGGNTTTFPSPYKCSLQDLPSTVTSVRGVMPIQRSRKTDGGDGNIQQGLISGASTGLGANQPITTAYTYWWDIFDADPNGSIAWTRIAFNALNLQLNRTL